RRVEEEKAKGEATRQRWEAEANLARALTAEKSAKDSLKLAEKNFKLAKRAVDETFGIAKDHKLFKRGEISPSLRELRKALLERPLPFYQDFEVQRPGDRAARAEVYLQPSRLGDIHRLLARRAEALKHYGEAERAARDLFKRRPEEPSRLI